MAWAKILEGATLGQAHGGRGQGRSLRAHHDDAEIGPELRGCAARGRARCFVGHDHVGDDQLALAFLDPLPERGGGALCCERVRPWRSIGAGGLDEGPCGIARSSSAIRIVELLMDLLGIPAWAAAASRGTSCGLVRFRIRWRRRDRSRSWRREPAREPVPVGLLVTKASNRWERDLVGDAAAVVPHGDDQRQVDLGLLARHREPQPVTKRRRQLDLALPVTRHFAGVLHEVEEYLNELVAISEHFRQRRIVAFHEAYVLAEAVLRQTARTWFST